MSIAATPPEGGIIAQLGEQSFPLLLRNGEIERFEKGLNIGIFDFLDQLLANSAKAHQCRDLVALGLVGAGMHDADADRVIDLLPPFASLAIRSVARELVFAAFSDPKASKKNGNQDGSLSEQSDPENIAATIG